MAFSSRPGNYISDLTTEDFDGYERSLQTLVLAENSLTILPEGIFRTLENLKTLNLRGNNIMTINPRAFQVRRGGGEGREGVRVGMEGWEGGEGRKKEMGNVGEGRWGWEGWGRR